MLSELMALALIALSAGSILRQVASNEQKQDILRSQYCFHEHVSYRFSRETTLRTGTLDYEVIYLHGDQYPKLVLRNNQQVPDAQQDEQKDGRAPDGGEHPWFTGGAFQNAMGINRRWFDSSCLTEHKLLRQGTLAGRKSWVIESKPSEGANTPDLCGMEITRRLVWIDQQDMVVSRREIDAALTDRLRLSISMVYEKGSGPTWLLRVAEINGWIKGPASKIPVEERHQFSEYRRFDVDSGITYHDKVR
jgi:hypothetical protein